MCIVSLLLNAFAPQNRLLLIGYGLGHVVEHCSCSEDVGDTVKLVFSWKCGRSSLFSDRRSLFLV